MYGLKTEASFDAAHFLKGYEGKCSNIHGHRWRVVVTITSEQLIGEEDVQHNGMIVDFSDLKSNLKQEADFLDHSLIYEKDSLKEVTIAALHDENFRLIEVGFRPTAENFAQYFFEKMKSYGFVVGQVEVYETPNNCASYYAE